MDMKTYLKQAAAAERETLAREAGTTVGYLYLIGGGHRRASSKLSQALAAAEPRLTLGELRPDIWGAADAAPIEAHPQEQQRRRQSDQDAATECGQQKSSGNAAA